MKIQLHAFEPFSRANGPGLRSVVWVQGCSLGCPGCFNPATHSVLSGFESDTVEVSGMIAAQIPRIEGVTISGGEPFQQPEALLDLLTRLDDSGLGRLLFSGYTMAEILESPRGNEILSHVDLLIAGRYDRHLPMSEGLLGSTNQQVHFLTNRYSSDDLASVPTRELILKPDGTVVASGIARWRR